MKEYRIYTDEELIDLWQRGNRSAGNKVIQRYYDVAVYFGLQYYKDRELTGTKFVNSRPLL